MRTHPILILAAVLLIIPVSGLAGETARQVFHNEGGGTFYSPAIIRSWDGLEIQVRKCERSDGAKVETAIQCRLDCDSKTVRILNDVPASAQDRLALTKLLERLCSDSSRCGGCEE